MEFDLFIVSVVSHHFLHEPGSGPRDGDRAAANGHGVPSEAAKHGIVAEKLVRQTGVCERCEHSRGGDAHPGTLGLCRLPNTKRHQTYPCF